MASLDPRMVVRVDIDAARLAEVLTDLAHAAEQLSDVLLAARDLLDESQATTEQAATEADDKDTHCKPGHCLCPADAD